ncbi:MAG TPA: 3-oxoacyl-[acyl-carrier-protein] reductase [Bacteroidales bacterium]|nr:3-oxoacyl-[acyl-carrier-protein] reductase [Bacteroidales bacterium]
MELLSQKVAIVTGGSRGIGRAIVETFAREGAKVLFTATSVLSSEMIESLNSIGAHYHFVRADASSFSAANEVVNACVEKFGRIDVLVNNAGITRDNLLMRMTEAEWDAVIGVNLKSVFNLTKAVQPVMLKQRAGSIINLSSIVGLGGNVGQANYAASKAGIIGFTKSVAKEIGSRNIRCNAIAPGLIDTDMTQKLTEELRDTLTKSIALRRMGVPEDVAKVALFLASDLSQYITGQVIGCDGGM